MDHAEQIDHAEHAYLDGLCPLCDHSPCISGAGKGGCDPAGIETEPERRLVNCYQVHDIEVHASGLVAYRSVGIADGDPERALDDAIKARADGLLIIDVRTGERWYQPCGPVRAWPDREAIDRRHQLDDMHRSRGEVLCGGTCDRWYQPADLDEWGTCGSIECLRAAVNP